MPRLTTLQRILRERYTDQRYYGPGSHYVYLRDKDERFTVDGKHSLFGEAEATRNRLAVALDKLIESEKARKA